MKTRKLVELIVASRSLRLHGKKLARQVFALLMGLFAVTARGNVPEPPGSPPPPLDTWSFGDTSGWKSDLGFAPISFTNLSASLLGDGTAVVIDSTNASWLRYNVSETGGTNNLRVDLGTVVCWFAPSWSGTNEGGSGVPGAVWGRLIEAGQYTTDASYGWWSLYLDPPGANIYFGAQSNNGSSAVYLSAPISWTTNRWHQIALTYSTTNIALYLDGTLAKSTNGLTIWPGPTVLANGFWIGSESNGNFMNGLIKLPKATAAKVYCLCFIAERSVDFASTNLSLWRDLLTFFSAERTRWFADLFDTLPNVPSAGKRQILSDNPFYLTWLRLWANFKPCPSLFGFDEGEIALVRTSLAAFQELLHFERPELTELTALRRNLGICQFIVERKWYNRSRWDVLRTVDHFCRNPALGEPLDPDTAIGKFIGY